MVGFALLSQYCDNRTAAARHGHRASAGTKPKAPVDPEPSQVRTVAAVEKVNLGERLARFQDLWSPKIVGRVNDFHVKLVKLKGEFVWHHHENEDELFLVLRGRMTVQLPQGDVEVGEGEFVVVPRGMQHRPVAREETHVLLLEPASTVNTGNIRDGRTRTELERI